MLDRKTQVRVVGVVAALALGIAAYVLLTAKHRDRATAGSAGNPVVLVLSPAHGDAELAAQLGAALSEESGLRVEVRRAGSRSLAVSSVGMPGVDGGVLPLFDYLLARQEFGVEAALQLVRGDGAREAVSVLLVREDSPVTTVAQLADQPVAFVDRASTTGYLVPARYLEDQRVPVRPVFTDGHDASLALLAKGDVAAAGTYAHARPGFRSLATAGSVPNEPVFFHPGLARATRDRLTTAFIALASEPGGRALLARMSEVTALVPVDDSAYAAAVDLLAATQRRLEDVVPQGRRLVEQRRAPMAPPMGD